MGIDPTVRHGANLGYIPVLVADACGAGHEETARRSIACLQYTGDALFTDAATLLPILHDAPTLR